MTAPDFYPPIAPYRTGKLVVDSIHTLYWEECGNPDGAPVVFLHGGPGAGCSPDHRRFFDPRGYRIILFDQRGAWRSQPHGEVANNTTSHLVEDLEKLRESLHIPAWHIFGGSWGSTLALAYAQENPARCLSLTLRAIFLLRAAEVAWFLNGVRNFAPRVWQEFADFLAPRLKDDILEGYWEMLNDGDPQVRRAAALAWAKYAGSCATLRESPHVMAEAGDLRVAVGLARIEVHYMRANRFEPDDLLLRQVQLIRHIPCAIVQGKYDLLCPPVTAQALHDAWPESSLQIIAAAGHSGSEPGIRAALIQIMNERLRHAGPQARG